MDVDSEFADKETKVSYYTGLREKQSIILHGLERKTKYHLTRA